MVDPGFFWDMISLSWQLGRPVGQEIAYKGYRATCDQGIVNGAFRTTVSLYVGETVFSASVDDHHSAAFWQQKYSREEMTKLKLIL